MIFALTFLAVLGWVLVLNWLAKWVEQPYSRR